MKRFLTTSLFCIGALAALAQRAEISSCDDGPEVDAPEVTKLFEENFPEYGPVKWRNVAMAPGEFFLLSDAITKEQKDVGQSIRVIGQDDNGDGILQKNEIRNFGFTAQNQFNRNMQEDLFFETTPEGWNLKKTIYVRVDPSTMGAKYGVYRSLTAIREIKLHRFVENEKGLDGALEKARETLHPAPKSAHMHGIKVI